MRCDQANNIPLHLYLETKGIYPIREKSTASGDTEFWYISPLRSAERTASFKVSVNENAWYDHGLAKGWTVVDLVVQMYRYSVREALRDIERSWVSQQIFPAKIQISQKLAWNMHGNKHSWSVSVVPSHLKNSSAFHTVSSLYREYDQIETNLGCVREGKGTSLSHPSQEYLSPQTASSSPCPAQTILPFDRIQEKNKQMQMALENLDLNIQRSSKNSSKGWSQKGFVGGNTIDQEHLLSNSKNAKIGKNKNVAEDASHPNTRAQNDLISSSSKIWSLGGDRDGLVYSASEKEKKRSGFEKPLFSWQGMSDEFVNAEPSWNIKDMGEMSDAVFLHPSPKVREYGTFRFLFESNIQHQALWQYLETRHISRDIAETYLRQIWFEHSMSGKSYFALGFRNGGGFEARNKLFKGFVWTGKTISVIEGANTAHILIFEGFMDALSYLSHKNMIIPDCTILVLNSGTLKKQAVEYITDHAPEEISLYLDRDHMGDAVTQFFADHLPKDCIIHDKRQSFAPHKDFNAWHIAYKNAHLIP